LLTYLLTDSTLRTRVELLAKLLNVLKYFNDFVTSNGAVTINSYVLYEGHLVMTVLLQQATKVPY